MQIFRIIGVWLFALIIASIILGGIRGFYTIFVTYGFFMTLPAIAILSIFAIIEAIFIHLGYSTASRAVGPILGLAVPVLLYLFAPNKSNAISALTHLVPITFGAGILWTASYSWFPRRS